jgi:predicted DNA-binding ribbon-helix-helix protein
LNYVVNMDSIRTSIDLPRDLHRRLHEVAARKGCSAHQLILRSIERAVEESTPKRPRRRLNLDTPIVPSTGKPFDLTNEQIYDLIDFP